MANLTKQLDSTRLTSICWFGGEVVRYPSETVVAMADAITPSAGIARGSRAS
ncbi:MAG: hypothetical protein M3081_00260 [Gemmatimonadota bacterium]|nr:hypothetical protein [Gemmatimonadota bacterium]